MGKRTIIEIDQELCDGCGSCETGCPEGALRIIDGKARLVGESLCDGLGACIGRCPKEAIRVIEREAEAYDEAAVLKEILPQGPEGYDRFRREKPAALSKPCGALGFATKAMDAAKSAGTV